MYTSSFKESDLNSLTEFFRALGDPTRLNILLLLMKQDTYVNDLAEQLQMTQSAVSHQLNILKYNKLVKQYRKGKMIFYTLIDEYVKVLIKIGIEHILKK